MRDESHRTADSSSTLTLGNDLDLINIVDGRLGRDTDGDAILKGINFQVKRGTMTIVTGPSGSGKTTLLRAVLGDEPCLLGSVRAVHGFNLHGGTAYCSQQPWLRNDTVRANIVGDRPYDEAWYTTVLHACSLDGVIHKLNQGMIGNGGTTLSGGQKQRIVGVYPEQMMRCKESWLR